MINLKKLVPKSVIAPTLLESPPPPYNILPHPPPPLYQFIGFSTLRGRKRRFTPPT